MLDPDQVTSHLPRWVRLLFVGGLTLAAAAVAVLGYRYMTLPTTLTIAAGSLDGEAARLMTSIAGRLAETKSSIRLKVIDTANAMESAKALSSGKVDLAIVRADVGDLSDARTVVLATHTVALIIVPPGAAMESIDDLKGKTIGVIGGEMNHRLVEVLTKEYDLARAKVQFKDLAPSEAQQAVRVRHVQALLAVVPLTEKYLALLRGLFQTSAKRKPGLIAIDSAGAIANFAPAYESYDVPKGTLHGSPPIPDDDLTTLRIPVYLAAKKSLDDDLVTSLTKAVMDARRELMGEFPLLAQLAAPSTDKDAYIPIHPGAAAFYDGSQKDFFDKYGNALYYGPMFIGALVSVFAAAWKFMRLGEGGAVASPLDPLYALARRIRGADNEAELSAVEEEIDNILKLELAKYARGRLEAGDAAALSLAAHRLEHLIDYRRAILQDRAATGLDATDGARISVATPPAG
jgi:TRAP transporter TAXI family solute receptor